MCIMFRMSAEDKKNYASYYEYLEARKEVDAFIAEIKEKTYNPSSESTLYTGSVSAVAAKLGSVTKDSDFGKLKKKRAFDAVSHLLRQFFIFCGKLRRAKLILRRINYGVVRARLQVVAIVVDGIKKIDPFAHMEAAFF